MIKSLVPAAVTFVLAAASAIAATPTIADVAPKDAAFVFSIDDFASTKAAFDKTGLRKVWDDPRTRDFISKNFKKEMDDLAKSFEDSGIKIDEMDPPSGPVGSAMWLTWNEKTRKLNPGLVAFGDWADKADAAAKQIESALAEGERKKHIAVKEDDYNGAKLWIIEFQEKPDAPKAAAANPSEDEEEYDFEDDDFAGGRGTMIDDLRTIVYARVGNVLVAASDVDTVERAIDRVSGKDAGDTVSDSPDFTATIAQLDKPQAYAAFFPGPMLNLMSVLREEAKKNPEGMDAVFTDDPSVTAVLSAFGMTGVKGTALGLRFDSPAAMMEYSYSVLCPDKKGVMSLFSGVNQKFAAPAFAGADAAGITCVQFKFADLLGVLTDGARALPPEFGDEMIQNIQQAQGIAGPILANLGPQVWIVQSITRPFSPASSQTLFALACKDPAQFNQALQNLGGMLPLQSRDFQGNQVWSIAGGMPLPGVGEIAIGVGFGHLFIGQTALVENAMRSAGNPDAASLNSEPRFSESVRSLKGEGLAFGWTDTRQTIEYADWTLKNTEKIMEAQFSGMFGDDPDAEQYKKEMIEEAKKNQPEWMKEVPLDVLARELGDSTFEFHLVPEGIKGRGLLLRPRAK